MRKNDLNDLLPEILLEIKTLKNQFDASHRWLNSNQAAKHISYTVDGLRKLKDVHLFLDVHYYKKSGKLIFDKYALDEWIMETKIA